jgi:hypothetical protein
LEAEVMIEKKDTICESAGCDLALRCHEYNHQRKDAEIATLTARSEAAEKERDEARADAGAMQVALDRVGKNLFAHAAEVDGLRKQAETSAEAAKQLSGVCNEWAATVAGLREENEGLRGRLGEVEQHLREMERDRDAAESALAAERKAHESTKAIAQLALDDRDAERKAHEETRANAQRWKEERDVLTAEYDTLRGRVGELEATYDDGVKVVAQAVNDRAKLAAAELKLSEQPYWEDIAKQRAEKLTAAEARVAQLEGALRDAKALDDAIEPLFEAQEPFIDGVDHSDEECPCDDTCECPEMVKLGAAYKRLQKARTRFHDEMRSLAPPATTSDPPLCDDCGEPRCICAENEALAERIAAADRGQPPATASETGKQHCKECGGIDPTKDEAEKHNRHPGVCIGCVNFCWREYGGDCATPAPPRVEPYPCGFCGGDHAVKDCPGKPFEPPRVEPATVRCGHYWESAGIECVLARGHAGVHSDGDGGSWVDEVNWRRGASVSPDVAGVAAMREACAKVADRYQEEAIRNAEKLPGPIGKAWEERSIGAAHVAQDIRALPLPAPAPMAVAVEATCKACGGYLAPMCPCCSASEAAFALSHIENAVEWLTKMREAALSALAATKRPAHD